MGEFLIYPLVANSPDYDMLIRDGVWIFYLIGQNRSSIQRLGKILEVQIRSFGAAARNACRPHAR